VVKVYKEDKKKKKCVENAMDRRDAGVQIKDTKVRGSERMLKKCPYKKKDHPVV